MTESGAINEQQRLLAIVRQLASEAQPGLTPDVTLHTSLERDLGLDSLARTELFLRVGKAFDVELPAETLSGIETPADLLRVLRLPGTQPAEIAAPVAPPETGAIRYPTEAETLVQVLEWHAARSPDRVHILLHDERHHERPLHHRDLLDGARAIAAGLLERGLQRGQTVALMLPTGVDYLDSFFGVMIAGGVPVPIYPPARLAQLEDHLRRHAGILNNAQATLIVTVEQAKPVALRLQAAVPSLAGIVTAVELRRPPAAAFPVLSGNDIAFLQYTSGSTGNPKGVVLTHANLLANVRALGQAAHAAPDDVFVSWLPLYHDMGLIGAWFGSLYHGIPLVLTAPQSFLARPALWLELLTRHAGTISAAPNFAYALCVRHVSDAALDRLDLSRWRLALNGAEPVNVATLETFAERFARCGLRRTTLAPVYGLAESSVGLTFPPPGRGPRIDTIRRAAFDREGRALPADSGEPDPLRIPSCGRALPGHAIRLMDETGYELPERRVGRLEFRGPSATAGYFRNPEASARLMRDGWLDSGDYAYQADGEIFVTGRVKDLIKRGGRNLYPYDLEEAVGNLPGLRKGCVAVFASADPATGSERLVVMAETRERDEAALARLRQLVNQTASDVVGLPADDVVLVPPHTVLKTSSGKIRRLASRELYERGNLQQGAAPPWLARIRLGWSLGLAWVRVRLRQLAARAYGFYAWLVFAALALPAAAFAALVRRPTLVRPVARHAARVLFVLTGIPLAARGLERLPTRPHVLLVNHASYLDALVLTALLPAAPGYTFAAKAEFARQYGMHSLLTSLGVLFVERADVAKGSQEVAAMATVLERGENLLVFPEGTFTREAGLRPFHLGAFAAAGRAKAPIVVAALRGTRIALRGSTWRPRRCRIEFEVGDVLVPAGQDWKAAAATSAQARPAMASLAQEYMLP